MAADNTPPRNGLILGIAAASFLTLGGLKFVFDGYYRYMMEEEIARKAAPPTELRAARLDEQQKLASGPMPIDKAIKEVAKEREGLIQPQQSADDAPLVGWSKMPREAPPAVPAGPASAGGDAGATDGGLATGDAGAPALAGADAGAQPNAATVDGGHALPAPHNPPTVPADGGAK